MESTQSRFHRRPDHLQRHQQRSLGDRKRNKRRHLRDPGRFPLRTLADRANRKTSKQTSKRQPPPRPRDRDRHAFRPPNCLAHLKIRHDARRSILGVSRLQKFAAPRDERHSSPRRLAKSRSASLYRRIRRTFRWSCKNSRRNRNQAKARKCRRGISGKLPRRRIASRRDAGHRHRNARRRFRTVRCHPHSLEQCRQRPRGTIARPHNSPRTRPQHHR